MKQTETNPTPTTADEARATLLAKANKHREIAVAKVKEARTLRRVANGILEEAYAEADKARNMLTEQDDRENYHTLMRRLKHGDSTSEMLEYGEKPYTGKPYREQEAD